MFNFKETTMAYCIACDKWREVGMFDSDKGYLQICSDCLCQFVIYIDPRISFRLNIKKSKIKFDWVNLKWIGLTIEQVKEMEKIYPDIDVLVEMKKMRQWLYDHRTEKRAQKSQWMAFITKWLKRAQRKALIG